MPQKSQKGDTNAQELIDSFKDLTTEAALRQFEKANRVALKSSPIVLVTFNSHWEGVVGSSYLVGITEIDIPKLQQKQQAGRIDPKSSDYKTERVFEKISWKKNVFAKGKGIDKETFHNFEITGIHSGNRFRQIAMRCKPTRIIDHLGEEVAGQILKAATKAIKGNINDLELPVMVEGHWEVQFSSKGSKWDKEDVEIQWEGNCLQIQRDVPVILPGRYIEVNDNATYPIYMKIGDQPCKITGRVKHFPCTVLAESTKEAYDKGKAEGDKVTRMTRKAEETG